MGLARRPEVDIIAPMRIACAFILFAMTAGRAMAHASEQAFVLLLPTDIYLAAGVAAVAVTVLLLTVLPSRLVRGIFTPVRLPRPNLHKLRPITSTGAFVLLCVLIWQGLNGPSDPSVNALPLFVWTVFWIVLVVSQATVGDLWSWLNPWTGPLKLIRAITGPQPLARLPTVVYPLAGIASFLLFAALLLVDPAPGDPARLARFIAVYWVVTLLLAVIFGSRWLRRAEGITVMMTAYARLGIVARRGAGLAGWQVLHRHPLPLGHAVLIVVLLGTGSFDGLNETFVWHGLIGINPLEFPGRSAVIGPTLAGLLLANATLLCVVAACIGIGTRLAGSPLPLHRAFRLFAPSILPIALGYHVAHYLTAFLVDGQYVLVALSDPFNTGADWLNLGPHYVTTGFFNTRPPCARSS